MHLILMCTATIRKNIDINMVILIYFQCFICYISLGLHYGRNFIYNNNRTNCIKYNMHFLLKFKIKINLTK